MSATAPGLTVIPCRMGRRSYAIPSSGVASIQGPGAFKPASTKTGPLGFIHLEDGETPVYSLQELIGLRGGPPRGLTSIVVMRGEPAWAIAVEAAGSSMELPLDRLYSVPRPLEDSLEEQCAA